MITFQNIGYLGRLGNQMFQFASTLGIGRKKGYEVKFPIENCRIPSNSGPIDVKTGNLTQVKCDLLDCFDIPEDYFVTSSRLQIYSLYNESKFEYDESIERIPDGTNLNGYFQTEKYFIEIKASRASPLSKTAKISNPELKKAGISFIECTAKSIS